MSRAVAPSPRATAPPRVLLAITESHPGGAQEGVLALLEELPRLGIVPGLACGGQGVVLQRARELGLATFPLPHMLRPLRPGADLAAASELRAAVQQFHPDLLHAHSFKAGLLARRLGERLELPTVFTVHGWSVYHRLGPPLNAVYMALERRLSRHSTSVYVCGADQAVAQRWGLPPGVLIPNGVRDRGVRRESPLPPQAPLELLTVARLSAAKAPLRTIRLLGELRRRHPTLDWRLTWVGAGPAEDRTRRELARQGLENRVRLVGDQADVAPYYRTAHAFLLLSRYEGSPLAVIEAMQARLLVLATAVGGVPELLEHGRAGVLLDPEASLKQLAHRLAGILSTPEGWERMRERAGSLGDRHSARAMAEAYAAAYRKIVAEKAPPSGAPAAAPG